MRRPTLSRPSAFAVLPAALLLAASVSGCHWFKHDTGFQKVGDARPLEVPPDLDAPDTAGAMLLPGAKPGSVTRSSLGAASAAASANGFTVPGDRDAVFAQVGDALAKIDGLTIASKAQLLGAYDVSYGGANFLVRVSKTDAGSYVSTVDPRGQAATGEGPAKVLAALKAALGG
ncbi:MAG: hypothetical protein ACTHOC_02230 [Luteimonas sp.]